MKSNGYTFLEDTNPLTHIYKFNRATYLCEIETKTKHINEQNHYNNSYKTPQTIDHNKYSTFTFVYVYEF